jgi:electron transfer flavoprotein beta subunit
MEIGMRCLVGVKRVLDAYARVRVKDGAIDMSGAKMAINPFCEIAVEEALRLKAKGIVSEIVAVTVGGEKSQETLRHALAMGADRATLVKTEDESLTPLLIAKLIKSIIDKEHPMLVLLGKQSIDADNNQTGQILAGLLSWPQATFASKIEANADMTAFEVSREVDSGIQVVRTPLPCVLTADLRLNEPRFATLPNLMKAKKKPLEVIEAKSLGVDLTSRIQTITIEEPPKRKAGKKVANVDELLHCLRNEAKVI